MTKDKNQNIKPTACRVKNGLDMPSDSLLAPSLSRCHTMSYDVIRWSGLEIGPSGALFRAPQTNHTMKYKIVASTIGDQLSFSTDRAFDLTFGDFLFIFAKRIKTKVIQKKRLISH
jgi:hypothetical protein